MNNSSSGIGVLDPWLSVPPETEMALLTSSTALESSIALSPSRIWP